MKRRKPRSYYGRRGSLKKFTRDCRKILEVLRERGPSTYSELRKYTKIPRGTIDRRLRHLKNIGVIINIRRKWMLAEYARTYRNVHEYKIYLSHSWQLIKGILAINEFLPQFLPKYDFYAGNILTEPKRKLKLRSDPKMWPYVLQHIKTGYPHIFDLYKKCVDILELIQRVEMENQQKLLTKLESKTIDARSVDISRNLNEKEMDKVESPGFSLALSDKERLELDRKAAQLRNMLEDELTKLILKVVNGEPLKGKCDCCPNVSFNEKPKTLPA